MTSSAIQINNFDSGAEAAILIQTCDLMLSSGLLFAWSMPVGSDRPEQFNYCRLIGELRSVQQLCRGR